MTAARSLDVADLPVYSISNRAPLWWGQFLMCVIEGSMLCMLIAIYFYLRLGVDVWPPPGAQLPFLKFPTLALVPLAPKIDLEFAVLWPEHTEPTPVMRAFSEIVRQTAEAILSRSVPPRSSGRRGRR